MQAVHSGADLESAITNCMGYRAEVIPFQLILWQLVFIPPIIHLSVINAYQGKGFMVGVQINPVSGLPAGFPVVHVLQYLRIL